VKLVRHTLVSLAVLVASLGVVGLVGGSPASAGPSYADRMEASVIAATNHKRVQRDRRAVRGNACLDRMAESWARHLAETNTLKHRRLGRVLSRCNRSYVSENLAKYPVRSGMTAAEVARGTVNAWMKSDAHRRNLLSRKPRLIGVGVARTANRNYWVVVQNFAR
jgi:uncharacterized protein YkwD